LNFHLKVHQETLIVIRSGTASPWNSISFIISTTVERAALSMFSPSSAIIFQPFLEPRAFLTLNDTSSTFFSGLVFLEFAAELFLDSEISLAALKLAALLKSLLKLLARLTAGERCGDDRRGEDGLMGFLLREGDGLTEEGDCGGEWHGGGDGDGDERGESSSMS